MAVHSTSPYLLATPNDSMEANASMDHLHGNATHPQGASNTNPRLVNGVVNLLLMLFNIGGNSLVFFVYGRLTKNTVFAFFVRVLAALDLLTACTTMLIDVITKTRPNDETQLDLDVMCKVSHFQVYANSLMGGSVLTLIAYQRYRKICHPLKRSIPLRRAKLLVAAIGLACVLISSPTLVVYGPMHIDVLWNGHLVRCVICRYDETHKGSYLQLVTSYGLLLAFSVVLMTIIILYVMVSRAIQRFERRNSTAAGSPTTNAVEIAAVNAKWDKPWVSPVNGCPITSPVHGRPITSPVNGRPAKAARPALPSAPPAPPVMEHMTRNAPATNRLSQARASIFSVATSNQVSAQMHRVFAVITVVFIVSYLPHLVVLILTKVLDLDHKVLTYGQRMALEFAYNCPYISTVSNPLVYGFSSSEFRDHLRDLLNCDYDPDSCCGCLCCCCYYCCQRTRSRSHSRHVIRR